MTRIARSVVLLGSSVVIAASCASDDGASGAGTGGAVGKAGASGKSGAAGSAAKSGGAGTAGKNGAGGMVGSAGRGGATSQGGAAGKRGGAGGRGGSAGIGGSGAALGGMAGSSEGGAAGGVEAGGASGEGPLCADGGMGGEAGAPCAVASVFTGLRWELPCTGPGNSVNCQCSSSVSSDVRMPGATGKSYDVTLRFRGIVEEKTYTVITAGDATGPVNPQLFLRSGTPDGGTFNIYSLTVSDPAQTLYLNSGSSGIDETFPIDYEATVTIKAGATVTLTANSVEGVETQNRDQQGMPVIVAGVPPAPDPYNGQFVQMDVVSVVVSP